MEAKRVAASPDEISERFDRLSSIVDGIPREFVLNMDQTGCSDLTDSREVQVIAPIAYPEPWISVASERHSKRCTLIARIADDGFGMKPFELFPRVTAQKELKYDGGQRFSSRASSIASKISRMMAERCFSWKISDHF
jgi:hypothetical protein